MRAAWGWQAAVLVLVISQSVRGRDLQQLALNFPTGDSGDSSSPAAASPSPAASSPSPASPSPLASPSPAASSSPSPSPAAAAMTTAPAMAPSAGAKAPASGAPGPAPMAGAGAPAPAGAAIATGAGDMRSTAPAPAPGLSADTTDVIYIQQSGNVQLTASASTPGAGTLSMNNALDTTLFDQELPLRKIGKTSSNNFLNAASNGTQWFNPPPLGVLLGFNTSANVYMLLSLTGPIYNFTTNTVAFNFTTIAPAAANANASTNGFLANYYLTSLGDSNTLPYTLTQPSATLFTPTLFTTIPCSITGAGQPNACSLAGKGACSGQGHGVWRNGSFCG